ATGSLPLLLVRRASRAVFPRAPGPGRATRACFPRRGHRRLPETVRGRVRTAHAGSGDSARAGGAARERIARTRPLCVPTPRVRAVGCRLLPRFPRRQKPHRLSRDGTNPGGGMEEFGGL